MTATGGTPPYSYSWVAPAGVSLSASSTSAVSATVTPIGVNTFTVTVSGMGGAPLSTTVGVTVNALPEANLINNGPLSCTNTSVTLTASGGSSYRFSNGATQINESNTATVSTAGTYSVIVTGANGCSAVAQTSVSQDNTSPPASLVASGTLSCAQTSVTLTANTGTGLTYRFSSGATQIGASNQATVSTSGTYSVTVTASNGCVSTTSVTVNQDNSVPTASLVASGTLSCAQTSVTLTANTGTGLTYRFSNGASQVGSSNQATVSTSGTYSVTVTASNGCVSTTSVTISQNTAPPTVSISPSSATLSCAQTSLTLTANPVANPGARLAALAATSDLRWNTGATTNSISVTTAGTYSVTYTATNGCTATNTVVISQDQTPPPASLVTSGALNSTQTSVTLTANTGMGLTYRFSSGASQIGSSNQATVSASGVYSVTVTATNGCFSTTSVTVGEDNTMVINSMPASNCRNSPFNIQFTASGTYTAGNTFTAWLSDASGNFASPIVLGSLSATIQGSFQPLYPGA